MNLLLLKIKYQVMLKAATVGYKIYLKYKDVANEYLVKLKEEVDKVESTKG